MIRTPPKFHLPARQNRLPCWLFASDTPSVDAPTSGTPPHGRDLRHCRNSVRCCRLAPAHDKLRAQHTVLSYHQEDRSTSSPLILSTQHQAPTLIRQDKPQRSRMCAFSLSRTRGWNRTRKCHHPKRSCWCFVERSHPSALRRQEPHMHGSDKCPCLN